MKYHRIITLKNGQESTFLAEKSDSPNEIEIVAFVNSQVAGTAGIESIGNKYKVRHRAEFGISLIKKYWGLGIGRALLDACIECAREAGFIEYGRNPYGFCSRTNGFQVLILMRKEL